MGVKYEHMFATSSATNPKTILWNYTSQIKLRTYFMLHIVPRGSLLTKRTEPECERAGQVSWPHNKLIASFHVEYQPRHTHASTNMQ